MACDTKASWLTERFLDSSTPQPEAFSCQNDSPAQGRTTSLDITPRARATAACCRAAGHGPRRPCSRTTTVGVADNGGARVAYSAPRPRGRPGCQDQSARPERLGRGLRRPPRRHEMGRQQSPPVRRSSLPDIDIRGRQLTFYAAHCRSGWVTSTMAMNASALAVAATERSTARNSSRSSRPTRASDRRDPPGGRTGCPAPRRAQRLRPRRRRQGRARKGRLGRRRVPRGRASARIRPHVPRRQPTC